MSPASSSPSPSSRRFLRPFLIRRGASSPLVARSLLVALSLLATFAVPASVTAQQDREPVLDEVRDLFTSEGLTLRFLLQGVVDAGVDDSPARARVSQARLRLEGLLDEGFGYKLQTNHVGTSTLLDAQVSWTPGPELTVAAGRFKTPFSREFLTYAGSIDFVSRSRVVTALAPNRQVGVQLGGRINDLLSWSAGGFTGQNTTTDESLLGVVRLEGAGIEVAEGTLSVAAQVAGGRDDAAGARQLGPAFSGDGILYGADARFESEFLMLAGEYIRGEWEPDVGLTEVESDGLYLTAGFNVTETRQLLVRWDRYEAPGQEADDILVFGFNAWPTSAAQLRVNWLVPLKDSDQIHRLLFGFQLGI